MYEAVHPERIVRFGTFELDLEGEELRRNGLRLKLTGQPFQVLAILLEHPGRVVTREELRNRLWANTFVDFDHNLNAAINKIREVLGDSAENPRFIETLARRGYRFIGVASNPSLGAKANSFPPAESAQAADAENIAPQTPAVVPDSVKIRRMWPWVGGAAVTLLFLLGACYWYLSRPLPPPHISKFSQITHDGRHKVPVATDGARLYLAFGNQPEPFAQVPSTGGNVTPFPLPLPVPYMHDVSPDGASLLISSSDHGRQSMWSVQSQGGASRMLWDTSQIIVSAKWSPDGKLVACYLSNGEIYFIRSDGAESPKRISFPTHSGTLNWDEGEISWSRDGSRIRFTRDSKLWEVSSTGSGLHKLLPDWHPSEQQLFGRWTQDGSYFIFVSRTPLPINDITPPPGQIWAIDERRSFLHRVRTEPMQLTSGPIHWGWPIPSRDDKVVFSRGVTLRGELIRFDPQSRELAPYLSGISAEWTDFSSDGMLSGRPTAMAAIRSR